jgi:hypothetical protein
MTKQKICQVPETSYFYPNVLGVLSDIGIALLIKAFRKPNDLVGLGLGDAIAINLCGGFTLAARLIFSVLDIPVGGRPGSPPTR